MDEYQNRGAHGQIASKARSCRARWLPRRTMPIDFERSGYRAQVPVAAQSKRQRTAQMAERLGASAPVRPPRHRSVGKNAEPADWLDINQLVEKARLTHSLSSKKRNLVWTSTCPKSYLRRSRSGRLRRIMANLLLNACLVSPTGGRITCRPTQTDGQCRARPDLFRCRRPDGQNGTRLSSFLCGTAAACRTKPWARSLTCPARAEPAGLGASGADLAASRPSSSRAGARLGWRLKNGVGTTFTCPAH